jgi:hypothetical protein
MIAMTMGNPLFRQLRGAKAAIADLVALLLHLAGETTVRELEVAAAILIRAAERWRVWQVDWRGLRVTVLLPGLC